MDNSLAEIPVWVQNLGKQILNGIPLSPEEELKLNNWRAVWKPEREGSAWEYRDVPVKRPNKKIVQHF